MRTLLPPNSSLPDTTLRPSAIDRPARQAYFCFAMTCSLIFVKVADGMIFRSTGHTQGTTRTRTEPSGPTASSSDPFLSR
jgi:hypothetical protein